MTPGTSIETPRLILRTVTSEDVEQVALSWNLDEEPIPIADAEQKISWMLTNHSHNTRRKLEHLCLAIILKETDEFIGWCGLDHLDKSKPDPALFYLLKAAYWGRGLATEAAQAVLNYAFDQLELSSIHAGVEKENFASKRVLEKIGMHYTGLDEEGGYSFKITRKK